MERPEFDWITEQNEAASDVIQRIETFGASWSVNSNLRNLLSDGQIARLYMGAMYHQFATVEQAGKYLAIIDDFTAHIDMDSQRLLQVIYIKVVLMAIVDAAKMCHCRW